MQGLHVVVIGGGKAAVDTAQVGGTPSAPLAEMRR